MQTNDITFSLAQILWLIGGITAIGAFIKWIIIPFKKLDDHETRIAALEKANNEQKEVIRYIATALNALVNYSIDGNDTDKLCEAREEYQSKIINHL